MIAAWVLVMQRVDLISVRHSFHVVNLVANGNVMTVGMERFRYGPMNTWTTWTNVRPTILSR